MGLNDGPYGRQPSSFGSSSEKAGAGSFRRRASFTRSSVRRPTRMQTALRRAATEKLDWSRALGRRLARLCTPCGGGCPQAPCGSSRAAGHRKPVYQRVKTENLQPETVPASVERTLRNGGALLNDLLEKKWPHISRWFGQTLKESLEPVLKKYVSDFVELGPSSLGTNPPSLQNVSTCLLEQDCQAEAGERTNMLVIGELEYSGNGEINVTVGSDRLGRVVLTDLKVAGRVVIELVKLSDVPPWFSGLRVYFPDVPDVDLTVRSQVFKLPIMAMQVKSIVIQQLMNTIKQYAVLPNRFAIELVNGEDPFQMRHPPPQGVLRIEVVRHVGKPQEDNRKVGEEGPHEPAGSSIPEEEVVEEPAEPPSGGGSSLSWFRSRLFGTAAKSLDSTADISVGTDTARCAAGEFRDFLLYDLDRQLVSFSVTGSAEGTASASTMTLVAEQGPEGAASANGSFLQRINSGDLAQAAPEDSGPLPCRPSDTKLSLESNAGHAAGCLHLRAQWRPLPSAEEVSEALTLSPSLNRWSFGSPGRATWLLLVDLYDATGLPYAEEGTAHWAKVSVRRRGAADFLAEEESPCASAGTPSQHGLQLLRRSMGGSFPAGAEEALQGAVSQQAWRQLLGRGGEASSSQHFGKSSNLVDAVWYHPFRLLLDSEDNGPLIEAIRHAELEVAVLRPEKGLERASSKRAGKRLGTARLSLASLLSEDGYGKDATLPLGGGSSSSSSSRSGQVRVRVQVRPLLLPPDFAGSQTLNQIRQAAQGIVDRLRANAFALVGRAPAGEDNNVQPGPADEDTQEQQAAESAAVRGGAAASRTWRQWLFAGGAASSSAPAEGADAGAAAGEAPASSVAAPAAAATAAAAAEGAVEEQQAVPAPAPAGYAARTYKWLFSGRSAAEASPPGHPDANQEEVSGCLSEVSLSEAVRKDLEEARQRSTPTSSGGIGEALNQPPGSSSPPGKTLSPIASGSTVVSSPAREEKASES